MNKSVLYKEISQAFAGVLSKKIPFDSALVSLIALIKEKLPYVSWVGFYFAQDKTLWVGPYQGKLACLEIPPGKGVCGAAFEQQKTLIVKDVNAFKGHIACDSLSLSEIVIPLWHEQTLKGVLDLDSHQLAAFDEVDQKELELLVLKLKNL